jgi:signal recognition particle subunit SRP72
LDFEKAYCLYRLNEVSYAFKIIDNIQNPSMQIKELKAQILYRLERYNDCLAIYSDIIQNTNDDYEDERETNFTAVLVNLVLEGFVSTIFLYFMYLLLFIYVCEKTIYRFMKLLH